MVVFLLQELKGKNEREDRNATKTYLDTKLPISKCHV